MYVDMYIYICAYSHVRIHVCNHTPTAGLPASRRYVHFQQCLFCLRNFCIPSETFIRCKTMSWRNGTEMNNFHASHPVTLPRAATAFKITGDRSPARHNRSSSSSSLLIFLAWQPGVPYQPFLQFLFVWAKNNILKHR